MKTAPSRQNVKRRKSGHSANTPPCSTFTWKNRRSCLTGKNQPILQTWLWCRFLFPTDYTATRTFPLCWESPPVIPSEAERSRGIPWRYLKLPSRGPSTSLGMTQVATRRGLPSQSVQRSMVAALFYAPSIGTDPGFADIILEQALAAKS